MARFSGEHDSSSILRAAEHWREKAFLGAGSVFSNEPLWRDPNFTALQKHFVDQPDEGEGTFFEKLEEQLSGTSAEVKKLTAEMLWFMFLCPSNVKIATKRRTIQQVWNWSGDPLSGDNPWLQDNILGGVGSAGTSFGVHRWRELVFFVRFLRSFRNLSRTEQGDLLSDGWKFAAWLGDLPDGHVRQLRHMVLYLLFPDTFERIFGGRHRRLLVQQFGKKEEADVLELSPLGIDRELAKIRSDQQARYPGKDLDFYLPPLKELWNPDDEAEPIYPANEPPRSIRYWVEKTLVAGRPDREDGTYALGKALWSPQAGSDGRDTYSAMREVRAGDVVLHLVDNRAIEGISVADGPVDDKFMGLPGTDWSGRKAYRIPLRDYEKLHPPLNREDFLGNPKYQDRLRTVAETQTGVFFNRALNLTQGGYLTEARPELLALLSEAYAEKTGRRLPLLPEGHLGRKGETWIFQANPDYYDIDSAIRELKEIRWVVKQYADRIESGDRVFIWRSGQDAGIIAVGGVTTSPAELDPDPDEEKYVKDEERLGSKALSVRIRIVEILDPPLMRSEIRQESTLANLSILRGPQGTNFAVSSKEAEAIDKLLRKPNVRAPLSGVQPTYTIADFVRESHISAVVLEGWRHQLERKKHIVFQGPPGTGKTYVAERLGRLLVSKTTGLVEIVQFHPSYAYEDFVQGIRPEVTGGQLAFEVRPGRFLEFCEEATRRSGAPCVLIIDELNRANLSRVFGELMYLLEYRNKSVPLASSGQSFHVPDNVYVVGTMNTADRSIALVDHALRRRFSFIYLDPNYEILRAHIKELGLPADALVEALHKVNTAIGDRNYEVGISYFLSDGSNLKTTLPVVWEGEIEPYLEEYFFDQRDKVDDLRWKKLSATLLKEWTE